MKSKVKIALVGVVLLGILSLLIGLSLYFKKHKDLSTTKPDFVVTAVMLQKEFEDNEKTASEKYINKIIEVNGTILSVNQADSTNINLSLKTESDLSTVICTFAATDPSKFREGEDVTIRGECSGFLMDVLLNNCALIK
jgi:cytochrome c-type biogenesis protein CcmE